MSKSGLRGWAWFFFALSLLNVAGGFYTMYRYGDASAYPADFTGHIVGGDAYNYIIIGVRGVGHLVAALAFAVIGACLVLRAGQVEMQEAMEGRPDESSRRQNETLRRLESESHSAD